MTIANATAAFASVTAMSSTVAAIETSSGSIPKYRKVQ
jgi:hypothetical protein